MRSLLPAPPIEAMGTVLALHGLPRPNAAHRAAIAAVFERWEALFSLYRPSSPLAQLAAGDLRLEDAPEEVRQVYAEAIEWRIRTNGAFTPHRPDGVIDLNGIVKSAAMREAAAQLHDLDEWVLNVGGDVLARVAAGTDRGAGIVDPADRGALLTVLPLPEGVSALATSGTAERGEHVWRSAPAEFVQVSVQHAEIVTADVLATAILADGLPALEDLAERFGAGVLAVRADGSVVATPELAARLPGAGAATSVH